MLTVDAKGKACPIPVVMTKKEIDAGAVELAVEVDNLTAVENVTRLAGRMGFALEKEDVEGGFRLTLTKQGDAASDAETAPAADYAVLVTRDVLGSGARELGESLMKMFFFTLSESADLPAVILLMNEGVKLASVNEAVAEHLQTLVNRGVMLLVCGTCLNYYGLTEQLKVGTVSNMYDILSEMQKAAKVISL